jgi:hypothetical protein
VRRFCNTIDQTQEEVTLIYDEIGELDELGILVGKTILDISPSINDPIHILIFSVIDRELSADRYELRVYGFSPIISPVENPDKYIGARVISARRKDWGEREGIIAIIKTTAGVIKVGWRARKSEWIRRFIVCRKQNKPD